jgi:hypothetical protein
MAKIRVSSVGATKDIATDMVVIGIMQALSVFDYPVDLRDQIIDHFNAGNFTKLRECIACSVELHKSIKGALLPHIPNGKMHHRVTLDYSVKTNIRI